jgi:hypothetical protein
LVDRVQIDGRAVETHSEAKHRKNEGGANHSPAIKGVLLPLLHPANMVAAGWTRYGRDRNVEDGACIALMGSIPAISSIR